MVQFANVYYLFHIGELVDKNYLNEFDFCEKNIMFVGYTIGSSGKTTFLACLYYTLYFSQPLVLVYFSASFNKRMYD